MSTVDKCLLKAAVGDKAQVCFIRNGWDPENKIIWRPSSEITLHQFVFPIIAHTSGFPVIGVEMGDLTSYGFSHNRDRRYDAKYISTYILYPRDIKVVRVYKKTTQ